MREVGVTGLGAVCPIGNTVEQAWTNALAGVSGTGAITRFDAEPYGCKIAAEVKGFDPAQYMDPKSVRRYDRFIHYAMAAASQAYEDARLDAAGFDPARFGVTVGSGIGGLETIYETSVKLLESGPRRVSPFFIPGIIGNMANGLLSIVFHLQGPSVTHVSACASGLHAIGEAARMIAMDEADLMMAGGTDAAITPLGIAGFDNMHAISRRNDDPGHASRPFDAARDGFVMGEGSGVLILEEKSRALARGARIYAQVSGYAMTSDAFHVTTPSTEGPARCMRLALQRAGLRAPDIGYLNAHGTSTPVGDANECQAIEEVFGPRGGDLVVSSTKSMTGHLLGGAGGLESVFTVLALFHQVVPPTINVENQDEACRVDCCANKARSMAFAHAMKNSFGFGGTNASIVYSLAR